MKHSLPNKLESVIQGYALAPVQTGHSDATVYKLEHPQNPDLFLKIQRSSNLGSLRFDADKLEWLHKRGILVPQMLLFLEEDSFEYLLTTAISGRDASNLWKQEEIPVLLEVLATNLKQLHALEMTDCPFNQKLEVKIADAKSRVLENLVDETDFDDVRIGKTIPETFQELLETRPKSEDLVFAHGDYCLPNVMIHKLEFSGFIDLGRAGIADRYQDLALMTRSLESDLNQQFNGYSQYFLEQYGVLEPDESKLEFYRLLDEFF